jgi:hypothetical protein
MYELIPIFAGVAAGLVALRFDAGRARAVVIAAVAVIAGITASVLSGEISDSWAFVLWDTAQALAAGALTLAGAAAWERGRGRAR